MSESFSAIESSHNPGRGTQVRLCSVFADGACRGNPGHSSFGVVGFSPEELAASLPKPGSRPIFCSAGYIGIKTNNEAEYLSLISALGACLERKIPSCSVFMDSQLVICQMQGKYKVSKANLRKLFTKAKELERRMDQVIYTHIPREKNLLADQLANDTLDEYLSQIRA